MNFLFSNIILRLLNYIKPPGAVIGNPVKTLWLEVYFYDEAWY